MPRKEPLSEREASVCRRLRQFREETKLSRVAFARHVGVDSSELVRVEHSRAPLRYSFARAVAQKFGVSLVWLAEGKGPMRQVEEIHPAVDAKIGERESLGTAYQKHLAGSLRNRAWLREATKSSKVKVSFPMPVGTPHDEEYIFAIRQTVTEYLNTVPRKLHAAFSADLHALMRRFTSDHAEQIEDAKRK